MTDADSAFVPSQFDRHFQTSFHLCSPIQSTHTLFSGRNRFSANLALNRGVAGYPLNGRSEADDFLNKVRKERLVFKRPGQNVGTP